MRLTEFDKWRLRRGQKAQQTTVLSSELDLMKLLMDGDRAPELRVINPTQLAYIQSDAPIKVYMGPAGSGKSVVGCADIMLKALLMPGTKWFIARRDYNDLMDTTARTMGNILRRLPEGTLIDRQKAAPMKWWIKPVVSGIDGTLPEPSEITFMGLSDDVGSYEYTGGFVDELDEVEEHYFFQMMGRLRSKPHPEFPDENFQIGGAFNPPPMTHWLYTACTGLNIAGEKVKEPRISLFRPEPKENQRNLPRDYYENMTATMPVELRQRYVDGAWGNTYPGEPVIRQFRRERHISPAPLRYMGGTLFRFWDFGYNRPAVLTCQLAMDGRIQILDEFLGHHIEGTRFVDTILARCAQKFPNCQKYVDYGDPAVAQHKDTGSMLKLLNDAGILMRYQRTPFDLSIQVLRKRFEMDIEGEPAILLDPSVRILADGLGGGYHLKDDGVTPRKDGYFDHEIDALRYGVWNLFGVTMSSLRPEEVMTSLVRKN
jgi:hypothetical protein